jgi:uncharacterized protein
MGEEGIQQDHAKARSWYLKAADQGHVEWRRRATDYMEALKWFSKSAEQGHAEAQTQIGIAYAKGWGVKLDFAEAGRWFEKAAEKGEAQAEFNLSVL